MTGGIVVQVLALGALVLCSALLTGAEAAYFSLGRARLRRVGGGNEAGAGRLIDRPHDLLVTLLVGITLINIAAAAIAAHLVAELVGARWGLVVEILGMVVLLTCGTNQCASIDDAAALAATAYARIKSLVPAVTK